MKLILPAWILMVSLAIHACHSRNQASQRPSTANSFSEVIELFSKPTRDIFYSQAVRDTFHIFKSFPIGYASDSGRYPLILLLDGNAYMEPLVAELSLARLTQGIPPCIIIGVGYKNFWTMDSLRVRDYTFVPDKEYPIVGGGLKFKSFLNDELIPDLKKKYRLKEDRLILIGHSLGGTFVLNYLFELTPDSPDPITHFISVSPPLEDNDNLLFIMEKEMVSRSPQLSFNLYACRGSLDRDTTALLNPFLEFQKQISGHNYPNGKIKVEEFGNFEHMDAAMPGFIKGLIFVLND